MKFRNWINPKMTDLNIVCNYAIYLAFVHVTQV